MSVSQYQYNTVAASHVETDMTCQAFAHWLTELKARSSKTLQEMLSEMSIIRDGITSNNLELTDFKRHSTGISQQMQAQLTDLREKLTNAFSEITALVKAKTQSDQEMMQDIHSLQQNLGVKTQELEALKRSYSQAHSQLQSSLIQIQNHLQMTNSEVQQAKSSCERVQRDTTFRFNEIDASLRTLEDDLNVGNAENRNQMLQLQEDIARIHDAITDVSAEFNDHKRATNSVHNKFQSAVWSLEEDRKRLQQAEQHGFRQQPSYEPLAAASSSHDVHISAAPASSQMAITTGATVPSFGHSAIQQQAYAPQLRPGSAQLPAMLPSTASTAVISPALPTKNFMTPQTMNVVTAAPGHPMMYRPVR